MNMLITNSDEFEYLCSVEDLVAGSGVCALRGEDQIALFYIPDAAPQLFAINNQDPFSGANVLARGIVSECKDTLAVASPLYKQHFALNSGACLEDAAVSVASYDVMLHKDAVWIRK